MTLSLKKINLERWYWFGFFGVMPLHIATAVNTVSQDLRSLGGAGNRY